MAKILIGLYGTLTEAEGVVQDLMEQGFARPHITLATPHATIPPSEDTGIKTCSTLEGEQGLKDLLLDLGVPDSEASTYVEEVRRGRSLVVVQASDEQAETAMDMLHRQRPADRYAGRTQWQYESNFAADFREHHRTTATESGLTYMEYEPAYRYGYDVGERYPDKDWRTLEAGIRRGWEMWHPGTWERFKGAIRFGWDTVRGPL
jgi:hypothetical protein